MVKLWNSSEEDGNVGVSVWKMKTLTVKMERVTLIGKCRYNLTCFVYKCMKLLAIFFFKTILGGCFRFGYIHFSFGTSAILWGCLRLELCCIQVNMVPFQSTLLLLVGSS